MKDACSNSVGVLLLQSQKKVILNAVWQTCIPDVKVDISEMDRKLSVRLMLKNLYSDKFKSWTVLKGKGSGTHANRDKW